MEQTFREIINDERFYDLYFKDKWESWNKLCSAMDVIGDTCLAINYFESSGIGNSDGEKYLKLYGLLQAVFLQQDAIKAIHDVIKETANDYHINIQQWGKYKGDNWGELRKYRNLSVGHPIECDRHEKGDVNRSFISRVTISDNGFQLLIDRDKKKDTRFEFVNLPGLVSAYKEEAVNILKDLEITLVNISKDKKFNGDK